MYWEGLLIISKSHYEALGPDRRFILTKKVHDRLHPEIPEKFIGKSIIIFGEPNGDIEYEIEGQNFLAVSAPQVKEFLTMSPKEAAKHYSDDWAECQYTGSSLVAKLYQSEQDTKLDNDEFQKKPKRRLFRFKTSSKNADEPADNDTGAASIALNNNVQEKPVKNRTTRMAINPFRKKYTLTRKEETPDNVTQENTKKPARTKTTRMTIGSFIKKDTSDTNKSTVDIPQATAAEKMSPKAETPQTAARSVPKKKTSRPSKKILEKTTQSQPSRKTERNNISRNNLPSRNYEIKKDTEKNKWSLKAIGASRAIGYYRTKAEATEKLNSLLANNSNASATIHKIDGTYQKHDTAPVRKENSRDSPKTRTSKKKRTS